jgi:hypothetical protein
MVTPSIAMIPSGYKAEKIYSVLPTNGAGDLTFNRNDTGTRVNKDGLIEEVATDVPRLDYSDGGCPSLLLEPQSTNLITKSNEVIATSNAVVTLNAAISPDGTSNAFKIKNTGTSSNSGGLLSLESTPTAGTFAASTVYTLSFYAKNLVGDGGFQARIDTDSTSALKQESFTATSNWQRFTTSFTTDAGSTEFGSNSRFKNFQQNGEVLFHGVQLEKQPFATSLIPTTNGILTRSADSASKTGLSSYISSTAGVLYLEIASASAEDNTTRIISLNDGGSINRVFIGFLSSGRTYAAINNQVVAYFTATDPTVFHKVAIKYEDNNTKFFANGNKIGSTEITQTAPSGLDTIKFTDGGSSNRFYGKLKDLRVYNTALTDAELVTLTTI